MLIKVSFDLVKILPIQLISEAQRLRPYFFLDYLLRPAINPGSTANVIFCFNWSEADTEQFYIGRFSVFSYPLITIETSKHSEKAGTALTYTMASQTLLPTQHLALRCIWKQLNLEVAKRTFTHISRFEPNLIVFSLDG